MTTSPAVAPSRDFTALPFARRAGWVVLLGSLMAIGAFTIDLYLPAFPVLQRDLSASASSVQLTLTGTMVGLAAGQLVVGPLSDALGRRRPLLAGLGVHLAASVLCVVAPSVVALGLLRVAQGLGMATASVIALASVRDRFEGRGAARLIARLMLVVGVSPVLAPSLGSLLLGLTSWRGIFAVLSVLSACLLVAVGLVLRESLPAGRRHRAGVRSSARAYGALLHDRAVVGLVVVAGLMMAAIFGYVSASSFVFQQQYALGGGGFALVFAGGGVALVSGSQANGSLVHRVSSPALLSGALVGATAAGAVLLATTSTGLLGLPGLVVPLYATMFCVGLAQPNSPVLALERHGEAAGTAAALLGFGQFGIAALVSPLTGVLTGVVGLRPSAAMGAVVCGALSAALVVLVTVVRPALRVPPPVVAPPVTDVAARTRAVTGPGGGPALLTAVGRGRTGQ